MVTTNWEGIQSVPISIHLKLSTGYTTQSSVEKNPMNDYTLHCDLFHCEACPIGAYCYQERVTELSALISKKTLEIASERLPEAMRQLLR